MTDRYEECPDCRQQREDGRLEAALRCHACKGSGIRIKPETRLCNGCGGNVCIDGYPHGLVDAKVTGGYASYHLFDCTTYRFSLCEECLRKIFGTFKVPPQVMDQYADPTYAEDLELYNYRCWKTAGGQRAKLATGLCNHREHCQNPAEWRLFVSGHMTDDAVCSKHREASINAMNIHPIPVSDIKGVPLEQAERTDEHKRQLADAWLKATGVDQQGNPAIIHHMYLGDVVMDFLEKGTDSTGGVWVPLGTCLAEDGTQDVPPILRDHRVARAYLPSGILCYGDVETIKGLARSPQPFLDLLRVQLP